MQTVGAKWVLIGQLNASTLVALVQTVSSLPVRFLGLSAGVLADFLDRRRFLLGVQSLLLAVGCLLVALTFSDQLSPALLLVLTFALGAGQAAQVPAYQALNLGGGAVALMMMILVKEVWVRTRLQNSQRFHSKIIVE